MKKVIARIIIALIIIGGVFVFVINTINAGWFFIASIVGAIIIMMAAVWAAKTIDEN